MYYGKNVFSYIHATVMPTEIFLFGTSFARTRSRLRWRELKINSIKIAASTRLRHFGSSNLARRHVRASTQNRPVFQAVLKLLARSERGPLITTGNCHYNFHPSRAQSLPPASHTGLGSSLPPSPPPPRHPRHDTCSVEFKTLSVVTVTSRIQRGTSQLS